MRLIDSDQLLDFIKFDERIIAPEEHTAEDIVMMIQAAPTISEPPNDPLTIDELREMGKEPEPIYITGLGWKICYGIEDCFGRPALKAGVTTRIYLDNYGEGFVAYRRKPEEGTT